MLLSRPFSAPPRQASAARLFRVVEGYARRNPGQKKRRHTSSSPSALAEGRTHHAPPLVTLPPRPIKSIDDFIALFRFTKVFQGLLMVKAEHADTKDKFLRLWCHEECRVFRDRLISAEDRTWFNDALQVPHIPDHHTQTLIAPVFCQSMGSYVPPTHAQAPFKWRGGGYPELIYSWYLSLGGQDKYVP